jgi:hypothetical protein
MEPVFFAQVQFGGRFYLLNVSACITVICFVKKWLINAGEKQCFFTKNRITFTIFDCLNEIG